jgi:Esterase-like activity of phytase
MKALAVFVVTLSVAFASRADRPKVIAISSISGLYEDFATQTAGLLENGVPGNRLGGLGSGLTYIGGDLFLALPDRGPNAVSFNPCTDDTVAYVNRFHTFHMNLSPADPGSQLSYTLTPMLTGTTLLSSKTELVYGAGCGSVGNGTPALNAKDRTHYFTGRSDGFDPSKLSTNPNDARFDTESIRVSNDLRTVYISDEYGPYVYAFDRASGERTEVFTLPVKLAVPNLSAVGNDEISGNTVGRIANKGMEGLAITPDGKMLVGAMQSPLIQDGGDTKGGVTRIVTIDIKSHVTHEYAYQLDLNTKTTISDIVAINDHQFLVDERDSKGRADAVGSKAGFKKLFIVDLNGAHDVSGLTGFTGTVAAPKANIGAFALTKTLFLDIVASLTTDAGLDPTVIPAKLEGITFGPDISAVDPVTLKPVKKHTLFVGNDNDFLATLLPPVGTGDNPNQWFVFSFSDADLPGFVPQQFGERDCDDGHGR